ncbi:MAG TPA: hypothetical protein VGG33_12820, partial [Polyangia bacterium]
MTATKRAGASFRAFCGLFGVRFVGLVLGGSLMGLACAGNPSGPGDVPATANGGRAGAGGGMGGRGGNAPTAGGSGGAGGAGRPMADAGAPIQPEVSLSWPLELLGSGAPDEPVVVATSLPLGMADIANVTGLYVLCHRCGFYEAPEYEALDKPLTKVKASLRILGGDSGNDVGSGGSWIDVTDGTVKVEAVAAAHGGINGALVTLGFTVPVDATTRARLGTDNRIEFRFNGTDGDSNGYRVLDLQWHDAAGKVLAAANKVWADPSVEKAAASALAEPAAKGRMLWSGRNLLTKSPIVTRKIRAACSDCHAAEGRDRQYFNYSNRSIVARSRFHGLSEEQGQQIAAYIRVANQTLTHVPAARPWNPPYQPGRGLDAKPIIEWAAGAGIESVLRDGQAFVKAFVGQTIDDRPLSVTQSELDAAMDPAKTLNMREMAVPLQFPDWNAWLPAIHPLDVWTPDGGQTQGLFEQPTKGDSPLKALASLEAWMLKNRNPSASYGDWAHLTPDLRAQGYAVLQNFGGRVNAFAGGGRGTRRSSDPANPFGVEVGGKKLQAALDATTAALAPTTTCGPIGPCASFSADAFIERANHNLHRWMAVKQWEVAHTWGLEGAQGHFRGSKDATGKWIGEGESRGWLYAWPSVFVVAPHMLYAPEQTPQGKRDFYFAWENRLVSYYRTNQWYQLQITINPGWKGASNGATDWPYHLGFTRAVVDDLMRAKAPTWVSAAHNARFFQIRTKLSQLAYTDFPFDAPDPLEPNNLFKNRGIQSRADLLFKLSPTGVMDNGPAANEQTQFRNLDAIAPGLHLLLVNASIRLYNAFFADTDPT